MIDFRLAILRVRNQISANKTVVLLAFISSVLCILCFTNLFIKYIPSLGDQRENNAKYRFYSVIFDEKLTKEELMELYRQIPPTDSFKVTNASASYSVTSEEEYDEKKIISTFLKETQFINNVELNGADLSKYSKLNDGEILLNRGSYRSNIPETVNINGRELKVIGTWEGIDPLVNFDTFINIFDIKQVVFRTTKVLENNELETLHNTLIKYGISSARTPLEVYQNDAESSKVVILIVNMIYVISLISYIMIFSNLMEFLEKDFRVYRIVGFSKKRIFYGLLIDLIVFITMSSVFAFIIQEVFWENFFSKVTDFSQRRISILEYSGIYLLVLLLSLIIISPNIIKLLNNIINKRKVND